MPVRSFVKHMQTTLDTAQVKADAQRVVVKSFGGTEADTTITIKQDGADSARITIRTDNQTVARYYASSNDWLEV